MRLVHKALERGGVTGPARIVIPTRIDALGDLTHLSGAFVGVAHELLFRRGEHELFTLLDQLVDTAGTQSSIRL